MAYPLIILGAGASHDFLKISRQSDQHILNAWRPPLINNIFDVSLFGRVIGKYEDIKPLASVVSNLTDSPTPFDFEEYLTNIESTYPENNYKKIMALRFYLAELFGRISYHFYRHTNNHSHLIYEIQNRGLKACIINYNYDTLFEKNIASITSSNKIDAYIQGDFKVIKMHGAHNWRYSPHTEVDKVDVYNLFISRAKELNIAYRNVETYPLTMPDINYDSTDFSLNNYREFNERESEWFYYLPALAIPIGTKGNHICPKSHIDTLIKELGSVDRILIIGWRAQDEYLLTLLKTHLRGGVGLTIVTRRSSSLNDFLPKFKNIPQLSTLDMKFDNRGYTEFMANRGYEEFLK